jgi:hypothetical protein
LSEQQYRVELEFSLLQIDGPIIAASDKAATNTARGSILDLEGLEVEKPWGGPKQ